jgi:MFS family permease
LALEIPAESQTWPASVFSLVTGAFLLPFGRLADIYGGRVMFTYGLAWFFIWSLIGGFSQNYLMLNFCRALQGLGPAAFLPSGIMLLGSIYRPGPRKNLVFSLYGACSPIGFFSGIFFAGLSGQYLPWGAYFWIGSGLLFLVTITAFIAVPSESPAGEESPHRVGMDWLGTATIVPGLMLLVYSITDSSHAPQGWKTTYIYLTFIFGVIFLGAAFYIEGWVAKTPLLPFDLFEVKRMKPLVLSLFLSYGIFGIYLFYASFYIEEILGASSLQTTAWFAPMAAGGLILATAGGLVLHIFSGTILLIISGVGYVISMLLFAIIPENPSYWAYIFPAMVCATIGVDITYNVSNVFITTNMPKHRQGLAGALINTLVFLGISFFLGIADISVAATNYLGREKSYKVAFWLGVGFSGVTLLLFLCFVRVGKAKSDLTIEEKAELEGELMLTTVTTVAVK